MENKTMMTDLYELTMSQVFFNQNVAKIHDQSNMLYIIRRS